jgi:hypothetical protein
MLNNARYQRHVDESTCYFTHAAYERDNLPSDKYRPIVSPSYPSFEYGEARIS